MNFNHIKKLSAPLKIFVLTYAIIQTLEIGKRTSWILAFIITHFTLLSRFIPFGHFLQLFNKLTIDKALERMALKQIQQENEWWTNSTKIYVRLENIIERRRL